MDMSEMWMRGTKLVTLTTIVDKPYILFECVKLKPYQIKTNMKTLSKSCTIYQARCQLLFFVLFYETLQEICDITNNKRYLELIDASTPKVFNNSFGIYVIKCKEILMRDILEDLRTKLNDKRCNVIKLFLEFLREICLQTIFSRFISFYFYYLSPIVDFCQILFSLIFGLTN